MSAERSPWLARLLLRWLLRDESGEFIVGDLEEEYGQRAARGGARRWYWRQVVGSVAARALRGRGRMGEEVYAMGMRGGAAPVMRDLAYAVRALRARPLFSWVVILTMGLGIGATTAMFSVVDAVLIEPLPYDDPGTLVTIWEHNLPRDRDRNVVSPASYLAWREEADAFQGLAAVVAASGTVTGGGEPERVGMVIASASFFPVMGVRAALGRVYSPAEDAPDAGVTPAVLGHGFWQRRYGGDPGIIGQTITLNGNDVAVVGVLPRHFRFEPDAAFNYTGSADVWIPHGFPETARDASGRYLQVVGRLEPGVTVAAAETQMKTIAARLAEARPDVHGGGWSANVLSLREQVVGDTSTPLLIVLGAVGFVLLIACANVANLLLVGATGRSRELAVRSALGASRGRVLRQLLTESGLLALAGGAVGSLLAYGCVRALLALGPDIPRIDEVGVDGRVLAFAAATSVLTGLLFGLAPAVRGTAIDLVDALKEGGGGGWGRGSRRARAALVVGEIALSLVLLVGAGLLLRSFAQLMDQGVGFPTERLLAASLDLPRRDYPDEAVQSRLYADLVDRVRELPGVEHASASTAPPLTGPATATSFWADDRAVPDQDQRPVADIRWVALDYFRTMGIPLLDGRTFDAGDDRDAPLRIVINRTMAEEFWPVESPLGRTISMPWGDVKVGHIIGVVGDVRHNGPAEPARSMIYWSQRQWLPFPSATLVVRTTGEPGAVMPAIRDAVRDLDPELPLYRVRAMEAYLQDSVAETRFALIALGGFALLALALAAVGIYGVVSYAVRQRTHEMGIRMALGAGRRDVIAMVLASGARMLAVALLIGILASLALARFMESMVFGVETSDPATLAGVSLVLALVTLAASYLPARRAARTDPRDALRYE